MGIPILISRSGFTEAGVKLAKDSGLVLIGRVKGKKFVIANGSDRIEYDANLNKLTLNDTISAQRKSLQV